MTYQIYTKCLSGGRHPRSTSLIAILGLLFAGCGSPGTITGKVLYQGKPMPGGTITFFTPDKGAMSGFIHPDGNYMVSKVPVGEVKIAIQSLRAKAASDSMQQMAKQGIKSGKVDREKLPSMMKKSLEHSEPASAGQPVQIPTHYADPEKSGLTYTVTGGDQTHDIELK